MAENEITDVTGFSNWGNPGSASGYDESAPVGGVLVGKKFTLGFVPLRVEVDGTYCGPGDPAQRCPYRIENELGLMRVGLVYRFGS